MSELLLIAVPGSDADGSPLLRVLVAPKLDAAPDVAAAGLVDWPAAIAGARMDVELADGARIEGVVPRVEADPEIWHAFFGALHVEGVVPVAVGAAPVVSPTSKLVSAVQATYRAAAGATVDASATEQPGFDAAVARELAERWAGDPDPDLPPPPAPAPPAATPDFHRVMALLREHPTVMRSLGLVFDLPIDPDRLGSRGTVRVRWSQPPAGLPAVLSPRTAYEVDAERGFVPAPTSTIKAGIVDLGDTDGWATVTFDVDGATGRLRDAARTVSQPGAPARLPPLRSAGVALLRLGRAGDFEDRRAAATANAALDSLEDAEPLTADDLMLGMRLDVRFKGQNMWTSLCRRAARYSVGGRDVRPAAEEEGHIKATAAVRHAGDVLRADEIVTRWTGWSLAVSPARPGSGAGGVQAAAVPFDFGWDFSVPAQSLLPLRFGRDYHLRARVADLAGGGIAPGDGDLTFGTDVISYVRYEPVPAPGIALPVELDPVTLGPGGTIEQLVIRSDAIDYPRNDERVLTPPTAGLDVVEHHGQLDEVDDVTLDRVRRALEGQLADPAAEGVTVFPRRERGDVEDRTQLLGWTGDWPDAAPKRLTLAPRIAGDEGPALRSAEDVRVFLAPGEQIRLELSSFLKDGFLDHFALHRWLSARPDGEPAPRAPGDDIDPVQALSKGRHPMASPARTLTLLHAVRRQTADPSGSLTPDQSEGATSAFLMPDNSMLGVDSACSIRLEVTARYTEVEDDTRREVVGDPVASVAIERGDEQLGFSHELGDTRHRMISYELAAVSRFRQFFDADEDNERFVARTVLAPVSVKSTARPMLPAVRAIVPAFGWEDLSADGIVRRRRTGGSLRVELLRPWHLSGDGEQLAVVVEQTEVARDPIWDTPVPDRTPPPSAYVPLQGQASVTLADDSQVTVVPYDVRFTGSHWFADIAMPSVAEASYRPFVRLALARYQRESLEGLELSAVTRAEMVQLLPERTLTVDPTSAVTVVVTLEGLGPAGFYVNRVDVVLEGCDSAEVTDLTVLEGEGIDGWRRLAQASGTLDRPIAVARPAIGALRVRVREVELLEDSDPWQDPWVGTLGELDERVVFTEIVALP